MLILTLNEDRRDLHLHRLETIEHSDYTGQCGEGRTQENRAESECRITVVPDRDQKSGDIVSYCVVSFEIRTENVVRFHIPFFMTGAPFIYSTPSSESASVVLLEVNGVSTAVSLKVVFLSPEASETSPARCLSAASWISLSVEFVNSRSDVLLPLDMFQNGTPDAVVKSSKFHVT